MDLSDKRCAVASRLEVDNVWLEYGQRRILQNIYVRVDVGQVVGLLGRNGYGKSSLLEVMYGTRSAQNRSVRINGQYVEKLYQHRKSVAFLPQKSFIPNKLQIGDAFGLYESRLTQATEFFSELMDLLPQRFEQLSEGNSG